MLEEKVGFLAEKYGGERLLLEVCHSAAGFYLGTRTPEGEPNTRESVEYWPTRREADNALLGRRQWTQKLQL